MLSEPSTATVRATLPVVGAAIGDIADLFYRKLFDAHPELLRDLFNRGNQASGAQRQALAGAIAAFASQLVEHPDTRPDVMLGRIAHKHASLGVTAAQYDVVHTHLFAAIAEVLGDAVTPEVAAAWDEVYWLMANALIAIEDRLYAQQGVAAGDVWRAWEVTARIEETADVATFQLRPADGAPAPAFRPGQYVSVQVELADGARQIRQYSLSSAPDSPVRTITVKRVHGGGSPDGEVSAHLHAHTRAGDRLRVSAPYGDLVLDGVDAPLLLASAGIGCTPMLSMLDHLAATGHSAPVTVVHGDRSPADHALRTDHERLTGKLPDAAAHFWYENPEPGHAADRTGPVDLSGLTVPAGTHAYLCGPPPFMRAVRAQLLAKGVPAADIHYEVFGPDLWFAQD
ncbi:MULTISPECIES: globin domain-containing protein [unclassified Streptomyces]|uniref:globin domain-containing protein n=1 Tax=unclassified Streptomyces TaxID=2593676 RepID=UPI0029B5A6A1|nr:MULTISPECIES: globin domain-containing protein [unclassified Streptomyces]MDX3765721.1 FAD-binding oxidoreductase [Streptomyces sp. AK08-01B]MDX3816106.1 FAD-binding oxidoreductase [Streptomyces sp. AK08-01A]